MTNNALKQVLLRLHTVLMIVLTALAVIMIAAIARGVRPRILITSSMEPFIHKNSLVLINTSEPYESLSEGKVIAFRAGGTEVLHRVSKVAEDGSLIAVPDNGTGEATVNKVDYVGMEIIAFPFIGGWLRGILRHAWVVVVLAAFLVVVGCLPYGKKKAA